TEGGARSGRAVVLQGPRADSCRECRNRGAAARRWAGRHRGARRDDRPRLAADGSESRSRGKHAASPAPRAPRVSERRRYGGEPRAAGSGGGGRRGGRGGAGGGAGGALPASEG